jgi:hypothetical protein
MDEMKNTFRNQFLKNCHPETHEMITNAERAYRAGHITREERDDAIKAAIAAETESLMLAALDKRIEKV